MRSPRPAASRIVCIVSPTATEPRTISLPLYRRMEPNVQLLEFKCAEFSEEFPHGEWRREGTPIGNPPQ